MKKIIQRTSLIFVGLLCFLIVVGVVKKHKEPIIQSLDVEKVSITSVAPVPSKKEIKTQSKEKIIGEPPITIRVAGNIHSVIWKRGETLIDTLVTLQKSDTGFSFKTKKYSNLGEFVYEINGVGESPGKYWLYYVNGIQGSVGVSSYVVQEGDSIEWKQE